MHRPALTAVLLPLAFAAGSCRAHESGLPAVYEEMQVPARELASPDIQRQGRVIYRERCLACHGEHADGKGSLGGALRPPPTDLTDSAWQARTDERHVYYAIAEGGHGKPMPPWKATLSPGEIWSLVAYIRTLVAPPAAAAGAPAAVGTSHLGRAGQQ